MRIRVAVIGLGWAGRSIWLPRLREHPEFEVVAAVDPEPVVRATVARDHGGFPMLASVDELDPAQVDLAVVAVPNHLHARVACGLLRRGIAVFLEKPVCLNSAEADQLATAEREGGAVLLAGSAARYRADVRCLHDLVESLGTVRHVDVSWIRARGVPDAGGWFTQRDLSGGGALVDLGWHLLDTLVPLLGSLDFDQVVGTVSDDFVSNGQWRASWRHDDDGADTRGDVEDTARGFLVSRDGVSVALRASWASHEPLDVTRITVEGSAGTATLRCTFGFSPNRHDDGSVLTLTQDGAAKVLPVTEEEIGTEYRRQLDELPALLADPASQGKTIAEVHRTIAVIERFYHSAHRAPNRRSPVAAG
jgi:oxidoreductase